jgi:nitrate reductase gamma subunit
MVIRATTIRTRAMAAAAFAIAALHLLLLFAPNAVLRWNRQTPRLLMLEAVGFVAGVLCSIASAGRLWRHLADRTDDERSLPTTVALTLVLVATLSGAALAAAYRWASSWSVVTLTPYVVSLLRLAPREELIAATPFIVRLHVFCAFPLVAVLVFTWLGSLAQTALDRVFDHGAAAIEHFRLHDVWREEEN